MVPKEWNWGPEDLTRESEQWWKITLEMLINTTEDNKTLWLQYAIGVKKNSIKKKRQ